MKEYGLKQGLLLTNAQDEENNVNDRKVTVIPVWKWLLEKQEPTIEAPKADAA
jgi:predicted AAA+ superfamily ATPase